MASPLKPQVGGSIVDLTADDGDDEPEVVITGPSPRASTSGVRRRTSTADTSPEKQLLDAVLQRGQQNLARSSGASPTKPATAGAARSASPPKPSSKPADQLSPGAPATGRTNGFASTPSGTFNSSSGPPRKPSPPVVLSSSSSVDPVEAEPRRSSRNSSTRRPSAPTSSKPPSRNSQPLASTRPVADAPVASPSTSAALNPAAEQQAGPSAPPSPPPSVTASSHTLQSATTTSAHHTPPPERPMPAPYFADLSPATVDVKPIIDFAQPAAQRPLRVIQDEAGQDVIDLEDTDDEEQSEDVDDDEDSEDDEAAGEHLGPSDGEGLGTEDDGRATGDDSGAEGDDDSEDEDEEGETDADASAMEIDNHLLEEDDAPPQVSGNLEAKLDAAQTAATSPRPILSGGTPQRNASAGPSTQTQRVPGFESGSSDFTSPTSSAMPAPGTEADAGEAGHPSLKKKMKRPRAETPPAPPPPVKPDLTLRLEHPVKLNDSTEFSLYEKALEMGQYDERTVEHFSLARIRQAVEAQRALEAKQGAKKRKRTSGVASANETPEEILARGLEEKYGAKKKKRYIGKEDDYDLDDGFVDDSTAMVDVPEFAGIPTEDGFFVHVGEIELRGELEDVDGDSQPRAKKSRKGSVDSSSDVPAKQPKGVIKRRQTNLSHLLMGTDAPVAVASTSSVQDVEMRDAHAMTMTSTVTATSLASATGPPLFIPVGLPVASKTYELTSTNGASSGPVPTAAAGLLPPTSVSNPVVLSSSSTGESPSSKPLIHQGPPAEPPTSQRPKSVSAKPEVAVPEPLIPAVQELRQKIKEHDWSNKKAFPDHLRPIIHRLVEAALAVDWYGADFFDLMPRLFPYNRFTMMKLIRRQEFSFHESLLQKQRARLVAQWRAEVLAEKEVQVPRYEAALKEWEARQRGKAQQQTEPQPDVPVPTPGLTIVLDSPEAQAAAMASGAVPPVIAPAQPLVPTSAAPHSPDAVLSQLPFVNGGPSTPNAKPIVEDRAPQHKMRLTQSLRDLLWTLYNITEEILELTNECKRFEGKREESPLKWRRALYADLASCFPEGFMHTTDLSRQVSQLKLKFDKSEKKEAAAE